MLLREMWPTIRASDGQRGGRGDLIQAVRGNENAHFKLWPTPHGFSTDGAVMMFPTPVSVSSTGGRLGLDGGSHARKALVKDHGEQALKDLTGGSLNPTWVEWLMGWPLGWTALGPLAMDRFQQWKHSHGRF